MNNKQIKNFTDLEVWQKANDLVLAIYKTTKSFPKEELFGIVSQLRRAALSITANIAEGFGRYHFKDKIKFYYQSRGSVSEVQNLLIVCKSLGYITEENSQQFFEESEKIQQMINGLIRSVGQTRAANGEWRMTKSSGFTLFELLIVMAIIVIIAGVTLMTLPVFQRGRELESDRNKIVAYLRQAQTKAISQESGQQWGIRFDNSGAAPQYKLFSGAAYSSAAETNFLSSNVGYGLPIYGVSRDVVFDKLYGTTATSTTVAINLKIKPALNAVIQISKKGIVSVAENPAGYWGFEDGQGTTALDNSGRGNSGSLIGFPIWRPNSPNCKVGNSCLEYDGGDSVRVIFPNNALGQGRGDYIPQGNVTFEMWFKTASASGGLQSVWGTNFGGGCDRIIWLSGGVLNFNAWSEVNFAGAAAVNDNNWHHLAYVMDKSWGFVAYLDGQIYAQTQTPTDNCGIGCSGFNWADTYKIGTGDGCRGGADGGDFNGLIDEVRLFPYVRTAAEIMSDYQAGL